MKHTCIDLFCGVGGLTLGFESANFETLFANDFDSKIANSYKKNFPKVPFYDGDITLLDYQKISKECNLSIGDIDVIMGGPPCQGYSMANRKRIESDERNLLFLEFVKCVEYFKPKCFLIENVVGMKEESIYHDNENKSVVNTIRDYFNNLDNVKYKIGFRVFKSEEHGVPQYRRRIILIGTRLENKKKALEFGEIGHLLPTHKSLEEIRILKKTDQNQISLLDNKHYKNMTNKKEPTTVWDAISDLPDIGAGEGQTVMDYDSSPINDYQKLMRRDSEHVLNHQSTPHSDEALKRIKLIEQGQNFRNLPKELQTKSVHSGAYGRLETDNLSPTITTRFDTPSTGRVIHPIRHRTLTVREAARIQSFPDKHQFLGSRTSQGKQVGNAVPPLVAKEIAKMFIRDFLG
jgi:DNA-cytosine methyltransferase